MAATPLCDSLRRQLIDDAIGRLNGASILPPPTRLLLQATGRRKHSVQLLDVAPHENIRPDEFEIVAVTGCLHRRPALLLEPAQIESFRDWSLAHPSEELAVRYWPLAAWLLASKQDIRFLELARDFVRRERARQQAELIAAAARLINRRSLRVA